MCSKLMYIEIHVEKDPLFESSKWMNQKDIALINHDDIFQLKGRDIAKVIW